MDQKAIKELEILHEVSKSEHLSQRHLSKKLGMAAGLVNMYMRRLAHKGYIKVSGMNHRRLKYLVTPRGIKEKTRLTYEFALVSYKYFKTATEDITEKLEELETSGQTSVVIFGTGELAELCLLLIKEHDIRVVAVVDDPTEGGTFLEYPLVPKALLGNMNFDKIIVAKLEGHDEISATLNEAGIEPERTCWLLDVKA
jgi:DNA-binding MarR family transcriptional regulator